MKKVGIVTLFDCDNYGNRLQCYALQQVLSSLEGVLALQIPNYSFLNENKHYYLRLLKHLTNLKSFSKNKRRKENFKIFERNINYSRFIYTAKTKKIDMDYVIVGSDQVWNPNFGRLRQVDLLSIIDPSKRISYAASFGVSDIQLNKIRMAVEELQKFKKISVREEDGKRIIERATKRKDIEVLLDPTMLLEKEQWIKVEKKPKMLKSKKYILNYFLGELDSNAELQIQKIAHENKCEVINILDKNSPFYECGPSEFLYLERNAFLICTDSFHSAVFSIIFGKPFVVFDRKQDGMKNMNSRIETLLSKTGLKNKKYLGDIQIKDYLECDYSTAYSIIEKEKEKSIRFIKEALDLK